MNFNAMGQMSLSELENQYQGQKQAAHKASEHVKTKQTECDKKVKDAQAAGAVKTKQAVADMHAAMRAATATADAIVIRTNEQRKAAINQAHTVNSLLSNKEAELCSAVHDVADLAAQKDALEQKVAALEAENFALFTKAESNSRLAGTHKMNLVKYKAAAHELATLLHVTRKEAFSYVKAAAAVKPEIDLKLEAAEMGTPSDEELAAYHEQCGIAAPTLARQLIDFPGSPKKRIAESELGYDATA